MYKYCSQYSAVKDSCMQKYDNNSYRWPSISCPAPPKPMACPQCSNLVQNHSFETGLSKWVTDNVTVSKHSPFEGTQAALMGIGVASISQDVLLSNNACYPLFLSFNVVAGSNNNSNGNLVPEVLWLDANRNTIGTGLRLFIPNRRINGNGRITYFYITDRSPVDAVWARLQLCKGAGTDQDTIELDEVILTPISSINLVQNPSFEAGLAHWNTTSFGLDFSSSLEGMTQATTTVNGELSQDVPISNLPVGSTFLLGFGVLSTGEDISSEASLTVQVQWLDAADNQIGSGLNLSIRGLTLVLQGNYLTYLDITDPAPYGTVRARIRFDAAVSFSNNFFAIDQVIFAKTGIKNLVINPSFENGLNGWTPVNTEAFSASDAYEGSNIALVLTYGGLLVQDVPILNAAGHCFMFNCGLKGFVQMIINLLWLDNSGHEIGLGLSLITGGTNDKWLVYAGITELAPPGTAAARIQFTKPEGLADVFDLVVLARLT